MGRKPKEIPKRVSGTGYSKADAHNLIYKKANPDGTFQIDTEAIRERVKAFIEANSDDNGIMRPNVSEAGLRDFLGIYSKGTFDSYKKGYVNPAHEADDAFIYNKSLSDALALGTVKIARALLESESGKYMSRIRERQLESCGELLPQKTVNEINANVQLGNKWVKNNK